jgi:hypothetical protein
MNKERIAARWSSADAYAYEVKVAARELRRAALAFLKVADRPLRDGSPAGFVVMPTDPAAVARLRELAELSCEICFQEPVD